MIYCRYMNVQFPALKKIKQAVYRNIFFMISTARKCESLEPAKNATMNSVQTATSVYLSTHG